MKFQYTGAGAEPEIYRKLRQFNNVQYCKYSKWCYGLPLGGLHCKSKQKRTEQKE